MYRDSWRRWEQMAAEYAIGRRARTGTLGSYQLAWSTRNEKLGKAGGLLGWLPLAGSMCIALGYAVIIPACFAYGLDVGAGPAA